MKNLFYCLLAIAISCSSSRYKTGDTFTTPSGTEVKFLDKGEGDSLINGRIILMHARYLTSDDKILMRSDPLNPLPMVYQKKIKNAGRVKDVLDNLVVGDSVYFEVPAKNLYEVSFGMNVPDSIDPSSNIKFYMRLLEQMDRPTYAKRMEELDRIRNKDKYEAEWEALKEYIEGNDIDARSTETGLYYEVLKKGEGSSIEKGDKVTVKYEGRLLDGKTFDRGDFSFVLGRGEVIRGWEEGISYLREGSRAVLYIPSQLGYGSRTAPNSPPPFSTLIFEIEILNVEKSNA